MPQPATLPAKGMSIIMSKHGNVSLSVIRRLPRYYRFLGELNKKGIAKISSKNLADLMGLTASQIRQDLNCFGGFGQQGYGYHVAALHQEIARILGLDHSYKTILIGAGNLGHAVTMHISFQSKGFDLIGIFDNNEALFGTDIAGHKILSSAQLEEFCRENKPQVAILCVPSEAAEQLSATLIGLGITGFWNFSHFDLAIRHPGITVENVHLGDGLMTLCYRMSHAE